MRATIRITWLLLSLSFLLHHVSSDDLNSTASTSSSTPAVTATSVNVSRTDIITQPTEKQQPTQKPTTAKPVSTTPVPSVLASSQSKFTDKLTNPSQTPTVTAPAPTTISSGPSTVVKDTTAPGATSSPPKPTTLAATANSSGISMVVPSTSTTPKPETSVTIVVTPTRNTTNVRTTQNPMVSTDAVTQSNQPMSHTTNPFTTSQADSKGGTGKTLVTVTSTSKTLEPSVNKGTTSSIPSTPAKTGPPPASSKEATTSLQTTTTTTTTSTTTITNTGPVAKNFSYSLNNKPEKDEDKELANVCKQLMVNFQDGDCLLMLEYHNGQPKFDAVEIKGKVNPSLAAQYYEDIKKPTDNKTLIAILASCGALLIMIVILAVCASHRRKPYNENQQHLTEELHTVENGYHDNPTLEVMEVQPEMQEKKVALNGEFNDSWIVPMDNLPKVCEEIPEEEDTHL